MTCTQKEALMKFNKFDDLINLLKKLNTPYTLSGPALLKKGNALLKRRAPLIYFIQVVQDSVDFYLTMVELEKSLPRAEEVFLFGKRFDYVKVSDAHCYFYRTNHKFDVSEFYYDIEAVFLDQNGALVDVHNVMRNYAHFTINPTKKINSVNALRKASFYVAQTGATVEDEKVIMDFSHTWQLVNRTGRYNLDNFWTILLSSPFSVTAINYLIKHKDPCVKRLADMKNEIYVNSMTYLSLTLSGGFLCNNMFIDLHTTIDDRDMSDVMLSWMTMCYSMAFSPQGTRNNADTCTSFLRSMYLSEARIIKILGLINVTVSYINERTCRNKDSFLDLQERNPYINCLNCLRLKSSYEKFVIKASSTMHDNLLNLMLESSRKGTLRGRDLIGRISVKNIPNALKMIKNHQGKKSVNDMLIMVEREYG